MTQTRRLLCIFLVTFLCLANSARAIAADELSAKIDQDLFLEDEGSGNGRDDESSGSGNGEDDEDSSREPVVNPDPNKKNKDLDFGGSNNVGAPGNTHEPINPVSVDPDHPKDRADNEVLGKKGAQPSFFSQPGILAAIICGAIVGLLCAILLVMFIVYRMRKKDEGSYVLDDSKRTTSTYGKSKEFYA